MDQTSLIGAQLDKYKIQAEIGRGGMGAVYLGYDPALDRHVAVKVLPPHLAWQTELVERFLREARTAARMRHPNIVTIYDVGQQGENYYFVMEYLEGETLTQLIQQRGMLSPQDTLAMLYPLAEALDYAHQRGLVHRDIKPANIVVDPDGHATLTDFGIARATQETRLTATGAVVGTPAYMSTEQAQGQEVDARSDQYSLAVVTYEMLSGKVPFDANSTLALLYKIINEPPPPIFEIRPDLPVAVQEVFDRALAKHPADRFPTVTAFVSAIDQALAVQSAPAYQPVTTTQRAAPAPKRRRVPAWVWALGGIALAALVVGGLVLLAGGGRAQATPTATQVEVAMATDTPTPTPTASLTATPRPTPTPDITATYERALFLTVIAPTDTPTPTRTPTASATPTRTPRPTQTSASTRTPTPTRTAAPSPTSPVTATPRPTSAPTASGALITFEQMGSWRRGDQPYGDLTQTQEQAHTGSYAAKLRYNFPTTDDDFVVFINSIGLSGQPNTVGAWVYGDGSGHYVNVWIQDAQNEIWSVHLGRVGSAGWQQMVGTLAPGQDWPSGHVSGPDNGVVDYPVRFYALVLDRPGSGSTSGQVYFDDVSAWQGTASVTPTPVATTSPGQPTAPAAPPPTGEIGHIIFTVKVGESYYLYSTDPSWSQMVQIGLTDYAHSTCGGTSTASTLEGVTVNLYGVSKCNITDRTDACRSPDGQYEVITNQTDTGHTVTLRQTGEADILHFYYHGRVNEPLGIQWAPNSNQFLFTIERNVQTAYISGPGYTPIIPELSDAWPPQFTPDGSSIYYLKPVGAEGASDVFAVGPDGSNARNLTNAPSAHKLCPRWRP